MLNRYFYIQALILALLVTPSSLAQNPESILGDHAITLDLKPLSADRVINLLSQRAKSISTETDWEVTGLEQLQDTIIDIDFSQVPVHEVVTEILGCSGFTYIEAGDGIAIEPLRRPFPRERCVHVIVNPTIVEGTELPSKHQTYTYQFDEIAVADFIDRFSEDSGLNILTTDSDTDLEELNVRVDMRAVPEPVVVRKLFHCIGWSYQQKDQIVRATDRGQLTTTDTCREFEVIP